MCPALPIRIQNRSAGLLHDVYLQTVLPGRNDSVNHVILALIRYPLVMSIVKCGDELTATEISATVEVHGPQRMKELRSNDTVPDIGPDLLAKDMRVRIMAVTRTNCIETQGNSGHDLALSIDGLLGLCDGHIGIESNTCSILSSELAEAERVTDEGPDRWFDPALHSIQPAELKKLGRMEWWTHVIDVMYCPGAAVIDNEHVGDLENIGKRCFGDGERCPSANDCSRV